MSEISSGLVAFCYMSDQYEVALFSEPPTDPLYDDMFPVVLLSDAEAIISAKDAEILEQCRINGMGAEREATLLGKVERQSAALKLAREVLMSVKETSSSTRLRRIVNEPIAAIDALGEVK